MITAMANKKLIQALLKKIKKNKYNIFAAFTAFIFTDYSIYLNQKCCNINP